MSIIAREMHLSEKKRETNIAYNAVLATGVTSLVKQIEYNSMLTGVNMSAFGLSGSPIYSLSVFRFNSTGGLTNVGLGLTLTPLAYGTSGSVGFSMTPPGATLLAGDLLTLTTGVANTAIATGILTIVEMPVFDYRSYLNTINGG